MPSQNSIRMIESYRTYREAIDALPITEHWVSYDWWSLPETLSLQWMAYGFMLPDYAIELANTINSLAYRIRQLKAWAQVMPPLDEDDHIEIAHEFVEPLGSFALGLPYVIRSRLIHATLDLCHQANRGWSPAWNDDLRRGNNLRLSDLDQCCSGWRNYPELRMAIATVASDQFKKATDDYRNRYNHQFPRRVLVGYTNFVTRSPAGAGRVDYTFGSHSPLGLGEITTSLMEEHDRCRKAFEAFKCLVDEHTGVIRTMND